MFANTYSYWPHFALWLLTVLLMFSLPPALLAWYHGRARVPLSRSSGLLLLLFLLALLFNMQLSWEMCHDEYAPEDDRQLPWGYVVGWQILVFSAVGAFTCSAVVRGAFGASRHSADSRSRGGPDLPSPGASSTP